MPAPAATPTPAPAPAPKPATEPAKPMPPVAAATAPAPAPIPAPKPPAPAADSADDVQLALRSWAKAWSSKDMKAYAAAYTSDFKGSQASHDAWLKARTAVIVPRKSIDVKVSDVKVQLKGERAEVNFKQDYASDGRDISSRKSIAMQKVGGKWLIRDESGR
jgi:ketosteroid isomerase-like protein